MSDSPFLAHEKWSPVLVSERQAVSTASRGAARYGSTTGKVAGVPDSADCARLRSRAIDSTPPETTVPVIWLGNNARCQNGELPGPSATNPVTCVKWA